jgi:hypothetical protein
MTMHLDDDIRTAFAELAATTTVTSNPRPGDIAPHADEPRRRGWPVLAVAAACIALVAGLALVARDRSGETTAPAATPPVVDEPVFLFPDMNSADRYDDPVAVMDAYFADRMTTAPPGATYTYTVSTDGPRVGDTDDRVLIQFEITVVPDDETLCCDSGNGYAVVERVDGSWFVSAAGNDAMQIVRLSYSDDGVVSGAYAPRIGGMYTATIDSFGWPGPPETGLAGEHEPDPTDPTNGPNFRSSGHTAPAIGVRFWQSPSPSNPFPAAMFAEYIIPRGASIEPGTPGMIDDIAADTTAPPTSTGSQQVPSLIGLTEGQARSALETRGLGVSVDYIDLLPGDAADATVVEQDIAEGSTVSTGAVITVTVGRSGRNAVTFFGSAEETARWYLDSRTSDGRLPDGSSVAVASVGTVWSPRDYDAWIEFEVASDGDRGTGVLRLRRVDDGSDAWTLFDAGVRGFAFDEVEWLDGVLAGSFTDQIGGGHELSIIDATTGERIYREVIATDDGETATFEIADLPSVAITIRVWNMGRPGGSEPAVFAELPMQPGGSGSADFSRLHDDYVNQRT